MARVPDRDVPVLRPRAVALLQEELDELKAMAMYAVDNLPESAPESVRDLARGDYTALLNYLDQVAADTTRIPHGNAQPSAQDKAVAQALTSVQKHTSLREKGQLEVVLASRGGVLARFDGRKLPFWAILGPFWPLRGTKAPATDSRAPGKRVV